MVNCQLLAFSNPFFFCFCMFRPASVLMVWDVFSVYWASLGLFYFYYCNLLLLFSHLCYTFLLLVPVHLCIFFCHDYVCFLNQRLLLQCGCHFSVKYFSVADLYMIVGHCFYVYIALKYVCQQVCFTRITHQSVWIWLIQTCSLILLLIRYSLNKYSFT